MVSGLAIGAFLFWDISSVAVASGHRDVTVLVVRDETDVVSSISYTTIDADMAQAVIADYPAPEPTFASVEEYDTAYRYAMDEFVKPILDDRLVVVWYDNEGMLVPDAAMFAIKNNISAYAVESWNNPRANHA